MGDAARRHVADYWDDHVRAWLTGADPLPKPLGDWYASYPGRGRGTVTREGFIEPFIGDLLGVQGQPRMVIMGLNPGYFDPPHQARDGAFADELRRLDSYTAWARSTPYARAPWTTAHGPNRYFESRLAFTRTWLQDPDAGYNDMLIMELYPWHSAAVTAAMRPPVEVVREFIWEPVGELTQVSKLFAFGRPWARSAEAMHLRCVRALGRGGTDYGSLVASRAIRVYEVPSGQLLIVAWHSGSAGPPRASETELLRHALRGTLAFGAACCARGVDEAVVEHCRSTATGRIGAMLALPRVRRRYLGSASGCDREHRRCVDLPGMLVVRGPSL